MAPPAAIDIGGVDSFTEIIPAGDSAACAPGSAKNSIDIKAPITAIVMNVRKISRMPLPRYLRIKNPMLSPDANLLTLAAKGYQRV